MAIAKIERKIAGRKCVLVYDRNSRELIGLAVNGYYITRESARTTRYPRYVIRAFQAAKRRYPRLGVDRLEEIREALGLQDLKVKIRTKP